MAESASGSDEAFNSIGVEPGDFMKALDCFGWRTRSGFTLLELLVVVAIIAVLASLIAVSTLSAMNRTRSVACVSNLRQLNVLMSTFVSDHHRYPLFIALPSDRESLPEEGTTWLGTLAPAEIRSAQAARGAALPKSIVLCPAVPKAIPVVRSDGNGADVNGMYGYNAYGSSNPGNLELLGLGLKLTPGDGVEPKRSPVRADEVLSPSRMIVCGDGVTGWNELYDDAIGIFARNANCFGTPASSARVEKRHRRKLNAAFCDGHVASHPLKELFSSNSALAESCWNRNVR